MAKSLSIAGAYFDGEGEPKSKTILVDSEGRISNYKRIEFFSVEEEEGTNSDRHYVGPFATLAVEVSGEFEGVLRFYGYINKDLRQKEIKKIREMDSGEEVTDGITEEGTYLLDIALYDRVFVRTSTLTSGEVSVIGTVFPFEESSRGLREDILVNLQNIDERLGKIESGETIISTENTENNVKQIPIFEEQASTRYSSWVDVSEFNTVVVYLEDDFEGAIIPYVRYHDGGDRERLYIYDILNNEYVNNFGKKGYYFIDVSSVTGLQMRIYEITSGSVTLSGNFYKELKPTPTPDVMEKRKIDIIEVQRDFAVGSGSEESVTIQNVSDYFFIFIAIRETSSLSHEFDINYSFSQSDVSGVTSAMMDKELLETVSSYRYTSGWIDVIGDSIRLYIDNKDDTDHEYNIVVRGIKNG